LNEEWHATLIRMGLAVFDSASDTRRSDPLEVAKARTQLARTLHGSKIRGTLLLPDRAA
jgi:hypothetical protein